MSDKTYKWTIRVLIGFQIIGCIAIALAPLLLLVTP